MDILATSASSTAQPTRLPFAPADSPWQPLVRTIFSDRPNETYDMLPMTIVTAVYDGPDGQIAKPPGYGQADSVLGEMVRRKLKKPITPETLQQVNRDWFYFEDRHIDRRWQVKHQQASPTTGRPTSETFGDLQKDWDFVMAFRDRILTREGLTAQSPPADIAYAIGWELCRNWRGGGMRNHPADVLTHRSWCLGAATAAMAIFESLGIPCRGSAVSEHATCEVLLDGKWQLIDSSSHIIERDPPSTALMPTDYVDLTTDPTSPMHGPLINDHHRSLFYHFADAHYGIPDGRWIRETLLEYCPAFAHALYPNRTNYKFKTLDPKRLAILKRDKVPAVVHFSLWQDLCPGDRLRDDVYVGDVSDVRAIELQLRLYPVDGQLPDKQQLAALTLTVGQHTFAVSDLANEPWETFKLDPAKLTLTLPVEAFKANAPNEFQWQHQGVNGQCNGLVFRFGLLPAVVVPGS